jgi:outer membrane protein TolC
MNRKICTVFTCVALCTPLFASSLSDIVDKALDQSNAVASAQATLVANQIAVKELLVDDDPSYSISSGDVTFGNADGDTTDYSFDPSFTYNPNDDNDTSFNLISDMVIDDGEWEGSKVSFSAQTTFDFNPDDTSDDIQAALNLKEAEYQYNKALLTVKGQVLSYISTILSYSESLLDAQNTLRLYQEAYDNALATGAYVAEDTQAVTQMAQIKAEENIVNNYMRNINLTKQQFLSYTGFEYPEEIEAEDIELEIQAENSNSLIQIARYQTQVYEEELRVLQQEDNQLTTEAGVASNIDADMSISGALAYEVNNLSVSGGLKTTYDWDDDTLYPSSNHWFYLYDR